MATILVIDRNVDRADNLVQLIKLRGYPVSVAYDSLLGIRLAEITRPNLVIYDVPTIGNDWCALRNHAEWVVAVNSRDMPDLDELEAALGAQTGNGSY